MYVCMKYSQKYLKQETIWLLIGICISLFKSGFVFCSEFKLSLAYVGAN